MTMGFYPKGFPSLKPSGNRVYDCPHKPVIRWEIGCLRRQKLHNSGQAGNPGTELLAWLVSQTFEMGIIPQQSY